MADINLTQAEADALLAMPKVRVNDEEWAYPGLGGAVSIPLVSEDKRENFLLDIERGRIDLLKGKYQSRGRQVVVLVGLDFGGSPHRNPDGKELACPHLHVYREGYGHKWAVPVPADAFPSMGDLWQTLDHFMRYCHVTQPPRIARGLFA
jgi:hypothetical protein